MLEKEYRKIFKHLIHLWWLDFHFVLLRDLVSSWQKPGDQPGDGHSVLSHLISLSSCLRILVCSLINLRHWSLAALCSSNVRLNKWLPSGVATIYR